MKQNRKRILSFVLSVIIIAASFSSLAVGVFASEAETDVEKGEFTYTPHTYTDGDLVDIYYYADSFFDGSANEYNEHLATMSMILASASISSQAPGVSYEDKSRNLALLLRDIDFSGFDVNEDYTERPEEQSMGAAAAYKVIGEGEDAYTVLTIVPRSAGYEREWAGNFTVGKDGLHQGFATGRDIVLEFAKSYVEENSFAFVGEVKVWTVGYSRGAGVANLLAAYLNDNKNALGVEVEKENIFAYTFGTPATVQYDSETERAVIEDLYKNIHNSYSEYDIISFVPFKEWGFAHYGTTNLFDVNNAEKKANMLRFLEKTNKSIYDLYVAENSSADPDNFAAVMLQLDTSDGIKPSIVPANSEYGIPTTLKGFLENRVSFLVNTVLTDRDAYVDGGYEYAIQRLTSMYYGFSQQESAEFISGMSQNLPALLAAYYCYFLSDFYLDTDEGIETVVALTESLPILEYYISALASDESVSGSEWYAYATEFIASDEYTALVALLTSIASSAEALADNMELIQQTIKDFATGMTAKLLLSGIEATSMDEEQKAELISVMTANDVVEPLTKLFVYLMLGSDNDRVSAFDPGNENIAYAVTFVVNSPRYMRVHNNEIILSWLRCDDSYYAEEDWHIHEEQILSSAEGHWHECACGYKTEVCQHVFSEWSHETVLVGGKEMTTRSCPCGYEEMKEAASDSSDDNGGIPVGGVIAISVGAAAIVASAVAVAIILIKRKRAQ